MGKNAHIDVFVFLILLSPAFVISQVQPVSHHLENIAEFSVPATDSLVLGTNASHLYLSNVTFRSITFASSARPLLIINLTAMIKVAVQQKQEEGSSNLSSVDVLVVIENCNFLPPNGKLESVSSYLRPGVVIEGPPTEEWSSSLAFKKVLLDNNVSAVNINITIVDNYFLSSEVRFYSVNVTDIFGIWNSASSVSKSSFLVDIRGNFFEITGLWRAIGQWGSAIFAQTFFSVVNVSLFGEQSQFLISENEFQSCDHYLSMTCIALGEYVSFQNSASFKIFNNVFNMSANDQTQFVLTASANFNGHLQFLSGANFYFGKNNISITSMNISKMVVGKLFMFYAITFSLAGSQTVFNVSHNVVRVEVGFGVAGVVDYVGSASSYPMVTEITNDATFLFERNTVYAKSVDRDLFGFHWNSNSFLILSSGGQYVVKMNHFDLLSDQGTARWFSMDCLVSCQEQLHVSDPFSVIRIESNFVQVLCPGTQYCYGILFSSTPLLVRNEGVLLIRQNDFTVFSSVKASVIDFISGTLLVTKSSALIIESNHFHGEELMNATTQFFGLIFEYTDIFVNASSAFVFRRNEIVVNGGFRMYGVRFWYTMELFRVEGHSTWQVSDNHFDFTSFLNNGDSAAISFFREVSIHILDASQMVFSGNTWKQLSNQTLRCHVMDIPNNFSMEDSSSLLIRNNNVIVQNSFEGAGAAFVRIYSSTVNTGFWHILRASIFFIDSNIISVEAAGDTFGIFTQNLNLDIKDYSSFEISKNDFTVYAKYSIKSVTAYASIICKFQIVNHSQYVLAYNQMNVTSEKREPSCLFHWSSLLFSQNSSWRIEGNVLNATRNDVVYDPDRPDGPDRLFVVLFYSKALWSITFEEHSRWIFRRNKLRPLIRVIHPTKAELVEFIELAGTTMRSQGAQNFVLLAENEFVGPHAQSQSPAAVPASGVERIIMEYTGPNRFFTSGLRKNVDLFTMRCNYCMSENQEQKSLLSSADYGNTSLFMVSSDFDSANGINFESCQDCMIAMDCAALPNINNVTFLAVSQECQCDCGTPSTELFELRLTVSLPSCYFNYSETKAMPLHLPEMDRPPVIEKTPSVTFARHSETLTMRTIKTKTVTEWLENTPSNTFPLFISRTATKDIDPPTTMELQSTSIAPSTALHTTSMNSASATSAAVATNQSMLNQSNTSTPLPPNISLVPSSTEAPKRIASPPKAMSTTVTAASSTAAVGGAIAGGGGAAGELQALAVMGLLTCADESIKETTEGTAWLITPLQLGNSSYGYLMGSGLIAFSAGVVHLGVVKVVEAGKRIPFSEACAKVWFPSKTFMVWNFCLQGIALESFRQLQSGEKTFPGIVLSIVSLLSFVSIAILIVGFDRKSIKKEAKFTRYKYSIRNFPKMFRWMLPIGFWGPIEFKAKFSTLMNSYTEGKTLFVLQSLGKTMVIAVIASFTVYTNAQCDTQYICVGAVALLSGIMTLACKPLRVGLNFMLSVVTDFFTAIVVASPGIELLRPFSTTLIGVLSVLSLFNIVASVAISFTERFSLHPKEMSERQKEAPLTEDPWEDHHDPSKESPMLPLSHEPSGSDMASSGLLNIPLLPTAYDLPPSVKYSQKKAPSMMATKISETRQELSLERELAEGERQLAMLQRAVQKVHARRSDESTNKSN